MSRLRVWRGIAYLLKDVFRDTLTFSSHKVQVSLNTINKRQGGDKRSFRCRQTDFQNKTPQMNRFYTTISFLQEKILASMINFMWWLILHGVRFFSQTLHQISRYSEFIILKPPIFISPYGEKANGIVEATLWRPYPKKLLKIEQCQYKVQQYNSINKLIKISFKYN